jgi:uncharacterized protein YyaL (SSP411 family)
MTNRLINETSPYLLQHANNPVDWFPWGPEAFTKASEENKPVLVSIGYAACHWCHVMEHESFENEAIAGKMNDLFVNIKVDREERPDIDSIYMQALMTMQGQGGWPLNMFLTPDGRPFYGGTYFPHNNRGRMPSWPHVLDSVSDAFHNRQDMVEQNARSLTETIQASAAAESPDEPVSTEVADDAYRSLATIFDSENGGFGGAPKFPSTMPQEFLMRYYLRTGEPHALEMVVHSLTLMAAGGIYDHLAGGFARYSTDDHWLAPHFEKMLYDNALLASAYLQAYQVTGESRFRQVCEETLDYLIAGLRHANGGFFSSQDADSEGVEGKYYVWTADEIDLVLTRDDAALLKAELGVDDGPNFEGKSILFRPLATQPDHQRLSYLKAELLKARCLRIPPATDDKVLTSWNALAIRTLSEAGAVLDQPRFRDAAALTAGLILQVMCPEGRLLRTWKDGKAHLLGYLEDYAHLVNALVSLHEATFEHAWLHAARDFTDKMLVLFWDEAAECFYDVGTDHERLIVRPRDQFDNAVPSGSSSAAEALFRMGVICGDARYTQTAERLLRGQVPVLPRAALGLGNWLKVVELYLATPAEIVIIGDPGADDTRALLRTLYANYRPNLTIVGQKPSEIAPFTSPLFDRRDQIGSGATAYVCSDYRCNLPTADPNVLADQLQAAPMNM